MVFFLNLLSLKPVSHEKDLCENVTDMEEECFPAIPINSTSNHIESTSSPLASSTTLTVVLKRDNVVSQEDNECPEIKGEPISAPASPCVPCQPSCDMVDDKSTITILSPHTINHAKTQISHIASDSEQDDESYYQVFRLGSISY